MSQNWRTPFGEVDLLMRNDRGRHFLIEVKSTPDFDYLDLRVRRPQRKRYQNILSWYEHENTQILYAYVSDENQILVLEQA